MTSDQELIDKGCVWDPETTTWKVPCEVYSRIVGYIRPTMNWNKGKVVEFKTRKTYKLWMLGNKS